MSYPKDLIYAWFKQIECLADKKDPKNQKPIDAELALRMIKEHAKQDAEYIEGFIGNIEYLPHSNYGNTKD